MGHPRPRSFRLSLSLSLRVGALLALASSAQAAEPSPGDRATARTLAQEGYEALRDRRYDVAADRFSRANGLVRAPTLLRDLARAQVGLGRLVDAHESYNTIIREGVAADAPASWVKALADAKAEIADVSARLPWITITVTGPPHPRVTIDGAPIGEASLGVRRPIDPGKHEIRALGQGYFPARKVVVVEEGEALNISFELEDAPLDAPPANEEKSGSVSVATVKPTTAWRKPATIGAFALGGAGLIVGGITGVLAIEKHKSLREVCPGGVCHPIHQGRYDNFRALANVSTIGFIVGAVGVSAGTVLLVLKPQASPTPSGAGSGTAFAWTPYIGVGSTGVQGTF